MASEILGDVAGRAGLGLVEQADRRADLARRAVAALEAVVLEEGLRDRVQRIVRRPGPRR